MEIETPPVINDYLYVALLMEGFFLGVLLTLP